MMIPPAPIRKPIAQLASFVRQDARKSIVLAMLVSVLAGLWVRMAMSGGAPATAVAAPAGQTPLVRESLGPARPTSEYGALADWLRTPSPAVSRNLFWLKLDYYPRASVAAAAESAPSPDEGLWRRVDKSMRDQADQRKQRLILTENLQTQARGLNVQGTVMGGDPKALVNGTMVREGDVVSGFRVLAIQPRGMVVEREGIRLEVLMK